MTEFYIVRHGQSQANAEGIVQGARVDTPLTEKGRHQAREVGETLKTISFDMIYCSDTLRAKETADIISKMYHVPVKSTPKIRERSYGKYEGMQAKVFLAKYTNFNTLTLDEKLDFQLDEDEESNRAGAFRLINFLEETAEKHPDETILVVSHSGLIRPFLIINGAGDFDTIGGLDNCGYIRVAADKNNYKILEMKGVESWAKKVSK